MHKDFDNWIDEKKRIHQIENGKRYHEREVWWCSLGVNVGFEQDGTGKDKQRPVLIVRSMSQRTCYVVPLTTSAKQHRYRISVGIVNGKQATAIISQMRLIDTKRLINKLGYLDKETFQNIRKTVSDMF